ncbi:MAG: hypothetical protein N2578_01910, partial [Bdellovibrionaceae bacterium]|nr:hypothetical protein [Pseudobdellovibrionaceae bacterium]
MSRFVKVIFLSLITTPFALAQTTTLNPPPATRNGEGGAGSSSIGTSSRDARDSNRTAQIVSSVVGTTLTTVG